MVLHGTSGVPDEQVITAVKNGICKVNYATDLRIAFTRGAKEFMAEHPEAFDPKKYSQQGMAEVQKYVEQKIEICGSVGKAYLHSSRRLQDNCYLQPFCWCCISYEI